MSANAVSIAASARSAARGIPNPRVHWSVVSARPPDEFRQCPGSGPDLQLDLEQAISRYHVAERAIRIVFQCREDVRHVARIIPHVHARAAVRVCARWRFAAIPRAARLPRCRSVDQVPAPAPALAPVASTRPRCTPPAVRAPPRRATRSAAECMLVSTWVATVTNMSRRAGPCNHRRSILFSLSLFLSTLSPNQQKRKRGPFENGPRPHHPSMRPLVGCRPSRRLA